jgi:iron complex outermembrane receptor protein
VQDYYSKVVEHLINYKEHKQRCAVIRIEIDNLIESNDQLGPEESTYINAGVVYSGIENLSVKVDYFDLEVDNVISGITVQSLINAEYSGVLDQIEAQYPGVNLDRAANGSVDGDVITRSANGAFLSRKGFDFELGYVIETDFGQFRLNSTTTYLTESGGDVYFGGPTQDFAGGPGTPEWRSQLVVNYAFSDFNVSWTTDAIASTAEDEFLDIGDGNPENFRYQFENHNGTYVTHNLNVSYTTDSYGRFTLGARNLFDKGVMFDDAGFWNDDTLYNAGHIGREFFAGYSIEF